MAPPFMTKHARSLPSGEHEMSSSRTHAPILVAALCAACAPGHPGGVEPEPAAPAFAWELPLGFPAPPVPPDNPMSAQKVELGRRLFYDKRLSSNGTFSCASCHLQALAFTDGRATAIGSTGQLHPRSSMSLANVAYASRLTWANPLMAALERQALVPQFGDAPVELGLHSIAQIEERLRGVAIYRTLFRASFPDAEEPITANHMNKALAAFERTLISGRSAFDRWYFDGDDSAMSESAQRGHALFDGPALGCSRCHAGFNFSDHTRAAGAARSEAPYHNTGLYNIDRGGTYPAPNTGVHEVTQNPADMGRFKAPSLRNIAVTAPYMHDGSIATLSEVLDHYAAGGRTILEGPTAGNGSQNPLKSERLTGFALGAAQRADLLAFLDSLTDDEFLGDPKFSDPWRE
jgi:cytochrome c peroxidase